MFEHALKARLPIVGVTTDDPINLECTLRHWVKPRVLAPLPLSKVVVLASDRVYWAWDSADLVQPSLYAKFVNAESQLILVNPVSPSKLVFDGGELPTPPDFIRDYLSHLVPDSKLSEVMQALKGCSLRSSGELVQLASAIYGEISAKTVGLTRMKMVGSTPGLYPLDTEIGYWQPNLAIKAWIELNRDFMREGVKPALQPKGLMLNGLPGSGKSMAAAVVAREFGVPAYRVDISTTLNRYIGESEGRLAKNLEMVSQSAPCVVLLDEVEKIFNGAGDNGTTQRLLSQLLWWMQTRKSPCPVIMTTNDLSKIPPELYRSERVDAIVDMEPLTRDEARTLGIKVFAELVGTPSLKAHSSIRQMFADQEGSYVPAYVHQRVVDYIKGGSK